MVPGKYRESVSIFYVKRLIYSEVEYIELHIIIELEDLLQCQESEVIMLN